MQDIFAPRGEFLLRGLIALLSEASIALRVQIAL
jgi:hypothetical protein